MKFTQNDNKFTDDNDKPYIECNRPFIVVLTFTFKKVGQRRAFIECYFFINPEKSHKILRYD